MTIPTPQPIALTPEEKALFDRIDFEVAGEYEVPMESLAAAGELMESLLVHDAIPEIRRRYLTDPDLNVRGRNKSRIDGFELNGTRGRNIFKHGNFLKYLRYLIFGPNLPEVTVSFSKTYTT
jgi:hypothetical protein